MGLRFGEIANLRWKHFDFDNGFAMLETTKNGDVRFVPLPDQVSAYLKGMQGPKLLEDFLFPSKNPASATPILSLEKPFKRQFKRLSFEISNSMT